jgi:putative ABC transport system substrate-binding protein
VIGFLNGRSPGEAAGIVAAFRQGLSETGYVEGENVAIEYRWAEGRYDRLPGLAPDLLRQREVSVKAGPPPARAAKNATSTVPIVFLGTDPIRDGLVASLARPGGNITGFTVLNVELNPKRLELLSELGDRAPREPEQSDSREHHRRRSGSGAHEGDAAPHLKGRH